MPYTVLNLFTLYILSWIKFTRIYRMLTIILNWNLILFTVHNYHIPIIFESFFVFQEFNVSSLKPLWDDKNSLSIYKKIIMKKYEHRWYKGIKTPTREILWNLDFLLRNEVLNKPDEILSSEASSDLFQWTFSCKGQRNYCALISNILTGICKLVISFIY